MSEKSEIRSEKMSELLLNEASSLLREVAGNRRADESNKAVLRRVGREVKDWTASRIKDVWYRDPRIRIRANEVEYLRALVSQSQGKKADVDELDALRTRIARLERLIEATNPALACAGLPADRQ
jgi:Lon protease-like protein